MMKETESMQETMAPETSVEAQMESPAATEAMMDAPAWFEIAFVDVQSGDSFKISDFHGKVVIVETMATWCPTCRRQQQALFEAVEKLGMPGEVVTVVLDIDPQEDAGQLKAYVEKNGFSGYYAVASSDAASQIAGLYGDQFLNPPSAPMLLVDGDGHVSPLNFGLKSVDDLLAAVKPLFQ
jgi:thiol-disulfide isomerase/thioredoxin